MITGRLYYDNYPRTMSMNDKINDILKRYEDKMGKPPEIVLVNPIALQDVELPEGLSTIVRVQEFVIPKHFLVGEENNG